MFPRARISRLILAVVICPSVFSGCSSEYSGGQNAQKPQQTENTTPQATHTQVGKASWYGPGVGDETASGEKFDQNAMTAAHPSLPLGTKAEVTNLENGKHVEVTINDRGPDVKGRAIDVSKGVAKQLDMKKTGIAEVKIVTKSAGKKPRKHSSHKRKRAKPSTVVGR